MKIIRSFIDKLLGSEMDFQDRMFMMLTWMIEIAVAIAFIADVILGENKVEVITLGINIIVAPIVCFILIRANKMKLCRIIVALAAVFVVLPITFFFGGGIRGGAVIWFSITYFYIGMILSGKFRIVMLSILSALAIFE